MTKRAFLIVSLSAFLVVVGFYLGGFYLFGGKAKVVGRIGGGSDVHDGLLASFYAPIIALDRRLEAGRDLKSACGDWRFSGTTPSGETFKGSLEIDTKHNYKFSVVRGTSQYSGSGKLIDDYNSTGLSCQTDPASIVVLGIRDLSALHGMPKNAMEAGYTMDVLFKLAWGVEENRCTMERSEPAIDEKPNKPAHDNP